ncbi:ABC transporter substrate-binding protein [Ramlibacter albus]|uniref:ABC transporter substrate-binding protein n=1 Tax=Ramlibacter albus TaxID=2079448 RepID=A0A923S1U8_9BURK|nr:ABC transporter substrate-binding protein [Ramlibacter albus]MBC5764078.1 ABC transporter substrate-binding protein [Ramlibacter albus]
MRTPSVLRRRTLLAAAAFVPVAGWAAPAKIPAWKLAQTTTLSGPLGDLGQALVQGAKVYFDEVNAKGGIHGKPIQLSTLDDAYDVKQALENVDTLFDENDVLALFNCFGTPLVTAMMPKVADTGIPFFAPYTGALAARPKMRNVFNIRASYPEEAERLVQHLSTLDIKRIAIAYQNNAFGKEVFNGTVQAAQKHKLPAPVSATVENDGSDAGKAAAKLADSNPQAVIVGLAGKPTVDFVKAIRAKQRGLALYALSVMGAAATLKAIGDDAARMNISQVVPLPSSPTAIVAREFRAAWSASGTKLEPSHVALEGYINARVFVEALRRSGPKTTRATLIDALWNLKQYDLGGFEIGFTEPGQNASKFVELTMVGPGGKLVR